MKGKNNKLWKYELCIGVCIGISLVIYGFISATYWLVITGIVNIILMRILNMNRECAIAFRKKEVTCKEVWRADRDARLKALSQDVLAVIQKHGVNINSSDIINTAVVDYIVDEGMAYGEPYCHKQLTIGFVYRKYGSI